MTAVPTNSFIQDSTMACPAEALPPLSSVASTAGSAVTKMTAVARTVGEGDVA